MKNIIGKFLKAAVVMICLTGFLQQTFQFLLLYWTYPTVVDVQVSVPSEIEMPAISVCNSNGIRPDVICDLGHFCSSEKMKRFLKLHKVIPEFRDYGNLSERFRDWVLSQPFIPLHLQIVEADKTKFNS
ncbi:uncharacterized protein NPIL_298351 [Nephila pilipes]|uniref:Uncharacterized protein n=1 Tax=Nephila pilipes TaxID=299642 RepID=A0A8X6PQE4_NEPPI|nr:uncharacterized protein NPIL_298351 [Nephila pilipes]